MCPVDGLSDHLSLLHELAEDRRFQERAVDGRSRSRERLDRAEMCDIDDSGTRQLKAVRDLAPVDIVSESQLLGEGARPAFAPLRRLRRCEADGCLESTQERVVDVRALIRREDDEGRERLDALEEIRNLLIRVAIVSITDVGALAEQC